MRVRHALATATIEAPLVDMAHHLLAVEAVGVWPGRQAGAASAASCAALWATSNRSSSSQGAGARTCSHIGLNSALSSWAIIITPAQAEVHAHHERTEPHRLVHRAQLAVLVNASLRWQTDQEA